MVFDGEELLKPAIQSIRNQVDFVAVTGQKTSYHGNPTNTDIESLIKMGSDQILLVKSQRLKISFASNRATIRNFA